MRAGLLRHRVYIEALTSTLDSDGATVEEWADAFGGVALSAEIAPLSGRELISAAALQSEVTTRIRIRYRPGVLPAMRVVHRETVYSIVAVIPDPVSGTSMLTLQCTSGVSDY
jgi:SPP1 family predicted phage head-tail adaptor